MKTIRIILPLILIPLFYLPAHSESLKIATWNIEHLRDSNNEGPNSRKQVDYDRLAEYVAQLDADIVALQEVEGVEAAKRVFDPIIYNFFFSSRNDVQLTGFAVKKNLNIIQNPDYSDLNVTGGLRHGTDITVNLNGESFRLLSVHLKSGCWGDSITSNKSACIKLSKQLIELEEWIDARAAEQIPFIVLGDFNRRMDIPNDAFWPEIDDGNPANADLSRVTEGKSSNCWDGEFPLYIDHIALDRIATKWVVDGSYKQLVYTEDEDLKKKLSDHCPISIIIDPSLVEDDPKMKKILNKINQIEKQLEELRQMVKETQPE
jgi:endonuclease/exonuclease/phosphatase family metal-dependent hydrolase